MKTPVFAHTANPAIDRPLIYAGKPRLDMLLATGAVIMISSKRAQYVGDRKEYAQTLPQRIPDTSSQGYDKAVSYGRKLVWVPCGETWQMLPCYGSVASHFKATKNGLNFAPNKSSNPSDHYDSRA